MEFDENEFGILPIEKDMYGYYRGKFIEVEGGHSYYGVYRGINTYDDLILFPFLRSESYEDDTESKKGNGQRAPRHLLMMQEPAFIHSKSVEAVIPIREEYIRFWLEKDNPKIILPIHTTK